MATRLAVEPGELVTVGDLDPVRGERVEFDFIGRRVGERYQILSWIAGGGMADVFCAFDERLETRVAVKILKPRMASGELRARMIQEARAAASVQHPQLIRIIDVLEFARTVCIVMELLQGPTLEQHLQAQDGLRLPWDAALALLLPTMDALHAVHEQGFIHRDIKAANLMLPERGGRRGAVVLDMGIVKVDRTQRTPLSPETTELGRVLGTPAYMSPEQCEGSRALDRRSDIYSMGVTLFRVLSGRLPFPHARGQAPESVLTQHCHQAPPSLLGLVPHGQVPPQIAAVVHQALAKDPDERPPTMQALADALCAALPTGARMATRMSTRVVHADGRSTARVAAPASASSRLWISSLLLAMMASGGVGWALRGAARPLASECAVQAPTEAVAAARGPTAGPEPAATRPRLAVTPEPPPSRVTAAEPSRVAMPPLVAAAEPSAPLVAAAGPHAGLESQPQRPSSPMATAMPSPPTPGRASAASERASRRALVIRLIERSVRRCHGEFGGPERGGVLRPGVELTAAGEVVRVMGAGAPGLASACVESQLAAQRFPAGRTALTVQHTMTY